MFAKGRGLRGTQQSRERLILRASAAGGCGPPANAETYILTTGLFICLSPTGVCSFCVRSCRRGRGFSGRLMPAGHFLSCATKKESKEVAGNAIPRSRLPSERKIAHSRVCNLYPCFDTNVRNRKYFLNLLLICRLKPGASEGQTSFASCSPSPGVAPG